MLTLPRAYRSRRFSRIKIHPAPELPLDGAGSRLLKGANCGMGESLPVQLDSSRHRSNCYSPATILIRKYGAARCCTAGFSACRGSDIDFTDRGPSLLFAVLGALAWTEFATRPKVTPGTLMLGLAGACRWALPSPAVNIISRCCLQRRCSALYQFREHGHASRERTMWSLTAIASLVLAAVPVLLLVLVWKAFPSQYGHQQILLELASWSGFELFPPFIAASTRWDICFHSHFPVIFGAKGFSDGESLRRSWVECSCAI